MPERQFQRRRRWLLRAAACLWAGAAVAAADPSPPPAEGVPAPTPSAIGFDALFRRLDIGDLVVVGSRQQQHVVRELAGLLPPNDLHRRLLLDSQRCLVDFSDAIQDGAAFAQARLDEAQAAGDSEAMARFHYCRGGFRESTAAPREAAADYDKGIELARRSEDSTLMAQGLVLRGGVNSVLGMHGKALADLLEAQRIYLQERATEPANTTFQSIGTAYRRLGYVDKAREYLVQSIAYEEQVGDRESLFVSTLQLGFTEEEAGNFAKALQTDLHAIDIGTATGVKGIEAPAQIAAASVMIELRRFDDARTQLDRAEAGMAAIGDTSALGMIAFERGRARAGSGQPAQAIDLYQRAEAAADFASNPRYLELLYLARAQASEALGRVPAALQDYKRYLAAHENVAHLRTDQQAQMLREQFDTDRSNLENARLKAERALKDRQVEALQNERRWQEVAMGLLAVLICLLLLLTLRQLARLRSWQRIASVDALTGIANRRAINLFGAQAFKRARAHHDALAVLVIDLDLFKRVNDRFGHPVGDRALVQVAQACHAGLREGDLIGRTGGEEFVAVLPRSTYAHALDVAERLRQRIETLQFHDLPEGVHTTISIGVAEIAPADAGFADTEKRADAALYRAKTEGRNRVFSAAPVVDHVDVEALREARPAAANDAASG